MLLAGQNRYWGEVEEATEFWLGLGIDHIMIKRAEDMQLLDENGKVIEEDFKKLHKLQEKYRVKYHLHPYNLVFNNVYVTSYFKNTQPILKQILTDLDKRIQKYGLYPLITIHPPEFDHPKHHFDIDEKTAFKDCIDFFQNLSLKSKLALETMSDPYRNPGHALLGYKPEHFLKLIGNKNFGLCIDIGHLKMAEEPLKKFLELPYPIYSVHLNGTDGTEDKHFLPTRENVGDFEGVVKALKKCQGPIVFEVRSYNYSEEEVKECIDFWKNSIKFIKNK